MLPHEDLAPHYETVIWLWVCRTWRDDDADLEAARIHDRFGVTSWPHLFVIDPRDDRVLRRAGRSTAALEAALSSGVATAEAVDPEGPTHELSRAYRHILAMEALEADSRRNRKELTGLLDDPDIVVRLRAARWLLERSPDVVLQKAESLLIEGNDPLRFAVLEALAKHPHPPLAPVLARLFAEAGKSIPSGNPNVVRSRIAACLASSGDATCIDALAPMAREANARNVTTRVVVEALGAIAVRSDQPTRTRIRQVLLAAWPPAVDEDAAHAVVLTRYACKLAHAVARALGEAAGREGVPPPPTAWSGDARATYIRQNIAD